MPNFGGTSPYTGLSPAAIKTAGYTAAPGEMVPGDTTTAGFTVTLPASPTVGAQVGVYKTDSSTNILTIVPSGTGTIDGDANAQCLTKNSGATVEHLGGDAWKTVSLYSAAGAAGYLRTSDASSTYQAVGSTFNRPYLHRALARVLSGTADAKIALFGDSTTYGFHDRPGIGAAENLCRLLIGAGIPAAPGFSIPNNAASGVANLDARYVIGAGWSQPTNNFSFGGQASFFAGNGAGANSLTFTPSGGYTYDRFDVWYIQFGGGGTVVANVDGGGNTTITTTNASNAFVKQTITCAAGSAHTLNLGSTTGTVYILGVEPWLSTTNRVRVGNMGASSTTSSDWIVSGGGFGPLVAVAAYAPDVSIINLGLNDANNGGGLSSTSLLSNLGTLATTCKASGDVYFQSPNPASATFNAQANTLVAGYAAALRPWCVTNGYGFIDLNTRWGGTAGNAKLDPLGYYYDVLHPSPLGYADVARLVVESLLHS